MAALALAVVWYSFVPSDKLVVLWLAILETSPVTSPVRSPVIVLVTSSVPPMCVFSAIPTPPSTINAPVAVLELVVVVFKFTAPVTSSVPLIVVFGVTVTRCPFVVVVNTIKSPALSLMLNASARLVGTTISFSVVAPLKFILSERYKSFHAIVPAPKS